jgi:carboxymethylenebutenolidase
MNHNAVQHNAVQIKLSYTSIQRFGANSQPLQAYQAQPASDVPLPAVLIIHEIYGLNDSIRNLAHNLAEQGYMSLAVDLFLGSSRLVRRAQAMMGMAKRQLHHGIQSDLQAALEYLHSHSDADPDKLGVVGFGMGGSYALHFASQDARLKAAGVYFALKPQPYEVTAQTCPIVGSFPENDFTTEDARQLQAALQSQGIPHDIKLYPQTLHSFTNEYTPAYNAAASEDSWNRLVAFFGSHLGSQERLQP